MNPVSSIAYAPGPVFTKPSPHYPTYIYDAAIVSASIAVLILVAHFFTPAATLARYGGFFYGGFGFFVFLSLVLAGVYYYQTQMGYKPATLLDTVDDSASTVCLHGYNPKDCVKCTDSTGKEGCGCSF